jgi:predicted DNA-binding transcriptional regulator YafY
MDPRTDETLADLTLREAAELYDVTVKTLVQHLRCGQLVGYKSRGAAGREWRVTRDALDDAGYRLRAQAAGAALSEGNELAQLRQQLDTAKRTASAERRRADDLDRRLGHALLECARLRAALAAATGEQDETPSALDSGSAR